MLQSFFRVIFRKDINNSNEVHLLLVNGDNALFTNLKQRLVHDTVSGVPVTTLEPILKAKLQRRVTEVTFNTVDTTLVCG